ncbi:MAG: FtsQ-type POTRA domain-containing protein [Gemmatimonadaceae bacterium]|nr:FtsQ-type POTRA domain-containing protein [Gemmatimonadaceae bacterium]
MPRRAASAGASSHLDYFHLQRVELVGARYLPPTDVAAALGADTAASVFDDAAAYASRVVALPLVASAEVERKLPGTLVVRIAERTPVALIATEGGLRAVDTAGTILPIDPVATPVDAPVVGAAAGARDPGADRRLLAFLGRVRAQEPALFDLLETARRVAPDEWQFTSAAGTRIRVAPEVTVARLATIFPVEQDLQQRRLRAAELDLRFRNLVIARLP